MDRRIVDRVESWESRPIEGGFAGLQSLVDDDFSGAVSATGTWLFMLNGRGVGVFGGSLDAFAGGSTTAYEAPDAALPLLFAMQESGGETYATYYTNDTPLTEVDETLTDANFTGYIELSENVLSGDYYVVYYGGRSMSAAFVGSSERLITGDEAYEKAADEVGIYEVTKVDLDLVDIPEPDGDVGGTETESNAASAFDEPALDADPGPTEAGTEAAGHGESPIEEAEPGSIGDPTPDMAGSTPDQSEGDAGGTEASATDLKTGGLADTIEAAESVEPTGDEDEQTPQEQADEAIADSPPDTTDPADSSASESTETAADSRTSPNDPEPAPQSEPGPGSDTHPESEPGASGAADATPGEDASTEPGGAGPAQSEAADTASDESSTPEAEDDPFSEEEQWRETRTIPALNPDQSEAPAEQSPPQSDPSSQRQSQSPEGSESAQPSQQANERARFDPSQSQPQSSSESVGQTQPASDEQIEQLREALETREEELDTLRGRHEEATAEIESLREERDELRARIDELEQAVEGADSGGHASGPSRSIDRETALSQTDLFVRYGSKGEGTLEKAHDGQATREDVAGNLRLEHHTRFEEDDVAVKGRPFAAFLEDTIEYRFVEWLVEDLLWEIQGTGSRGKLKDLFDALPAIDRAEFGGTVSTRDEEGEERSREFDVIVRDRMGQPLIVANINDQRDPATGEMMESLVEASTDVAEALDTLGAAFQVTASFFQPDALETASGATGSGLLSRDKRESFVKLSRKQGYHLCLVESRGDDFHVTVPEL